MNSHKIALSRQELYERVWTTPLQKLAKEFGLSDVGLAKLCRRHQIPTPGRGYWARLAAGQKLTRIALPPIQDAKLDTIEIVPCPPHLKRQSAPTNELQAPRVVVEEGRPITHPFALRTERLLKRTRKDERGVLYSNIGNTSHVKVSTESVPRVLLILDALFRATEEAGHTVKWKNPQEEPLKLIVLEEELQLTISEAFNRKDHTLTREELIQKKAGHWWNIPRWDYTPTGRLKVAIRAGERLEAMHTWSDGKKRRLENYLGHFVAALPLVANGLKKEREDRARWERERAEQAKREAEAHLRQMEYDRKAKVVAKLAQAWQESDQLRSFASALKAAAESSTTPPEQRQEIRALAEWTLRHANHVDPFTDLAWAVKHFKNPPWQWSY